MNDTAFDKSRQFVETTIDNLNIADVTPSMIEHTVRALRHSNVNDAFNASSYVQLHIDCLKRHKK